MAKKKKVGGVSLLPDGRAVRVIKMDSRRMQDLIERVGRQLPPVKPGEKPVVDPGMQAHIRNLTERATIAMCVKGITLRPVELKYKTRPLTNDEMESALAAKMPVPTEMTEGIDFDATLGDLAKNPTDPRWTALGEAQLENEAEENEFSMFELFDETLAWRAVLDRIDRAGGGSIIDPFAGKLLKTTAG